MSFDIVDMPSLGVHIPASFKRIAELRSTHRDAASGDLDIRQYGHAATGEINLTWTSNGGNVSLINHRELKIPISEFSRALHRLNFPVTLI
jgi:hypothetical protein